MDSLVIIIGDNFIGGIDLYNTTLRTMKIRKISASPITVVSSKKIIGLEDTIISQNMVNLIKSEPWAFTVPGQPGLYAIQPSVYNGEVGVMTIPARGEATANFIKDVMTSYPELVIIPVVLKPESINGSLARLTNSYKLSDEVASKIYSDYKEHIEWRENVVPENIETITIEYPHISSLGTAMYVSKIIDRITNKN